MIVKVDGVPGVCFANLLSFVHGKENLGTIPENDYRPMIVRIKSVNPDNQGGGTWYGITLEITEWLPGAGGLGQTRVEPQYLMKVYEILGQRPE